MNAFQTLMWLEFRKYSGWLIGLVALLAGSYWLFVQILRNTSRVVEGSGAVVAFGSTVLIATVVVFTFFYGAESGRDYRNGRWALLIGSPLPGWLHLTVRVLFSFVVITLFTFAMLAMIQQMAFKPVGVEVPLGSYLSLWVYCLGGLPVIIFSLFTTMFTTAYLPRKAQVIAGFVGVLGFFELISFVARLLEKVAFRLPTWKVPLPDFSRLQTDIQGEMGVANGLPTEGFLALLVVSALLFYLTSRMWHEVEA